MTLVPRAVSLLPPLLVFCLLLAPGVEAACTTVHDEIRVPSPGGDPPKVRHQTLTHGINSHFVTTPIHGSTYALHPMPGTAVSVVCHATCTSIPDFNIAWYDSGGNLVSDHDDAGAQTGSILTTYAFGVIYMAWGPDAGNSDGKFPGAQFEFKMDCP